MRPRLVIGTRKSALALWQSEFIKSRLCAVFPGLVIELKHIVTQGDRTQDSQAAIPAIGGKGLFTFELEEALKAGDIDLAVHSLKDLPTLIAPDFVLGAIPVRSSVEDVVISRSGCRLADLPTGAAIGTSSVRRSSQILRMRADFQALHIRGNVDTRIRKVKDPHGPFDAIILAAAGLSRLGLELEITEVLNRDDMLPAPGQGALAVECRANDTHLIDMLSRLHDRHTAAAVGAERAFLAALEAGCNTPVAALATVEIRDAQEIVVCRGRCLSTDGRRVIETSGECVMGDELELGCRMADDALAQGFRDLR